MKTLEQLEKEYKIICWKIAKLKIEQYYDIKWNLKSQPVLRKDIIDQCIWIAWEDFKEWDHLRVEALYEGDKYIWYIYFKI